jgi:hypothetical protein
MTFIPAFFSMPASARLLPLGFIPLLVCQTAFGGISSLADLRQFLPGNSPSAAVASPAAPPPKPAAASDSSFFAAPGPWGKLHCSYIYLEAPQSLVDMVPMPDLRTRWTFARADEKRLPSLFKSAGLSDRFTTALLDCTKTVVENDRIHLFPARPDLEAMRPEARALIYSELAKIPGNAFYCEPFLMVGQSVAECFRTSKLRPELVAKITQMSYLRGDTLAFSDVSALLSHAKDEVEARQIFKSLTRTRSLLVSMKVEPDTDISEAVKYWTHGAGLRGKDIEPLLQSIKDIEGGDSLPISHLLPPLARELLYTYPGLDWTKYGDTPDCHWTSLNFFKAQPSPYLLDSRLASSSVIENFEPVPPPYQYGDLLFFIDDTTRQAVHSCVHLADDIVYTKNGSNFLVPWLLMKLEEVEKLYLYQGGRSVKAYRRKAPEPTVTGAE